MNAAAERDALLAAVLAEPDDDGPRLVLADFLEENGESERAGFIRVQCELTRLEADTTPMHLGFDPAEEHVFAPRMKLNPQWRLRERRKQALYRRERELLDRLGAHGVLGGPLPLLCTLRLEGQGDGGRLHCCLLRRGFACAVTCTLAAWLAHGPAIVRCQPVTRVECRDRRPIEIAGDWNWMPGRPEPESPWFVGLDVYTLLDLPIAMIGRMEMNARCAPTQAAAEGALSAALLAWAHLPENDR